MGEFSVEGVKAETICPAYLMSLRVSFVSIGGDLTEDVGEELWTMDEERVGFGGRELKEWAIFAKEGPTDGGGLA